MKFGLVENRNILLVEDNPDDEELTLLALRDSAVDCSCVVLHDGAEALSYLFGTGAYRDREPKTNPRLVILDLKLPKIGGLEVLRRMRAEQSTSCIPIVVMTTSNQDDDIINSYKAGANSYIRKPVEYQRFGEVIRNMCAYWLTMNEVPLAD